MAAKSNQRKQKKTKVLPQVNLYSGSEKGSRFQRKNQSIDFYNYDDDEEQYCDGWKDESQMKDGYPGKWGDIYQAVDENNADLLHALLPPVHILNIKPKSLSNNVYYWMNSSLGEDLLRRAVDIQHVDCVDVLLDKVHSKDLSPDIFDSERDLYDIHDPLIIACKRDNLKIVQMLIERGHARRFFSHGFFIAFDRRNEPLMDYLMTRCDLRREFHGDQAILDCLINGGYLELAKRLILYGYTQRNCDRFSPMMLAVHHDLTSLIDLLFERLPQQEALDELTLLACHYTINGDAQNREKAFDLFVRGLIQEEESAETPLPHEVYENHRECKTVAELEAIRNDENALRMHSLIVSERISLRLGEVNFLVKLIGRQCDFYRTHRLSHRSFQLRIHAYHLIKQHRPYFCILSPWRFNYAIELMRDIDRACNENGTVPIELIEIMLTKLFEEDEGFYTCISFIVCDCFTLLVHMIQLTTTTSEQRRSLFNIAQRAMRYDMVGNNPLVRFIETQMTDSPESHFSFDDVSALSVIQLMIRCNANVNEIGGIDRTRPLHAIALCFNTDFAKSIIELLLAHGAHADSIDNYGQLPQNRAWDPAIKDLLSPTRNLSLKCRCAQLIVSNRINYQHCLSPELVAFVQLHTIPKK